MFYDLNVLWAPGANDELRRTLAFLDELGYNTIALTHTISGKLPADLSCPIPTTPYPGCKLRILRRVLLIASDPSQNHRLSSLSQNYDIISLRPTNAASLATCLTLPNIDLISLDLTTRLGFHLRNTPLRSAVARGVRFEITYAPSILHSDPVSARRNLITNAMALIRATGGRGIVISSEARTALGLRAPAEITNLGTVWGLAQDKGRDAVGREAKAVVVAAEMRRKSWRGVVDVVYGGEAKKVDETKATGENNKTPGKRKAEAIVGGDGGKGELTPPQPLSKRQQKKLKKAAQDLGKTSSAVTMTGSVESAAVQ